MEIARDLLPPGMELVVVDPSKPEFYDAAADAEWIRQHSTLGVRAGAALGRAGVAESARVVLEGGTSDATLRTDRA